MDVPAHYLFYSFSTILVFSISLLLSLSIEKFITEIVGTYKNRLVEELNEKKLRIENLSRQLIVDHTTISTNGIITEAPLEKLMRNIEKITSKLTSYNLMIKEAEAELEKDGKALIAQGLRPCVEISMFSAMLGLSYLVIGGVEHASYFNFKGDYVVYIFAYTVVAILNLWYFIHKVKSTEYVENSKFEIFSRTGKQMKRVLFISLFIFIFLGAISYFDLIAFLLSVSPIIGIIFLWAYKIASYHLITTLIALCTLFIPLFLTGKKMKEHSQQLRMKVTLHVLTEDISNLAKEAENLNKKVQAILILDMDELFTQSDSK